MKILPEPIGLKKRYFSRFMAILAGNDYSQGRRQGVSNSVSSDQLFDIKVQKIGLVVLQEFREA